MSVLSPWALLWLGSVPVLIWLWRFAASRHQTILPSLVPFEHLVRRPPTRRSRLLVNLLFWLQLAALILIALALAEPVLTAAKTRTVLVLLDTSASMSATSGGPSPFQRARRVLASRLARQRPDERLFVVGTAPVRAITDTPLSELTPAPMAGNLSMARRIGQALLGTQPDEILVLTDESAPGRLGAAVSFQSFGQPQPNVAIVGLDAHEPLCGPSQTRIVVTVQNMADAEQDVGLSVTQQGRVLATATQIVPPSSRVPITLDLPDGASGVLDVSVRARRDALALDNRALVMLRGSSSIPVLVASEREVFVDSIGSWLEPCPRLAWEPVRLRDGAAGLPPAKPEAVLVTDQPALVSGWPGEAIVFARASSAPPVILTQWLVDAAHPVGEYLSPLETVATAIVPAQAEPLWGEPVIWGVVNGQRVPLVRAASVQGRRLVGVLADPTASSPSIPLVVVFLNGLRWVTGSMGFIMTGEPLTVGPFASGTVRVQRPDGTVEGVAHPGGLLRYEATDQIGRYRFTPPLHARAGFIQGEHAIERLVNFLDPVESNTMTRLSTWSDEPVVSAVAASPRGRRHPLAAWLLGLLVVVLLVEWGLYLRRGRRS